MDVLPLWLLMSWPLPRSLANVGGVSFLPLGVLLTRAIAFQGCHVEHLTSRGGILRVCPGSEALKGEGRKQKAPCMEDGQSAHLPFSLFLQVSPWGLIWCYEC